MSTTKYKAGQLVRGAKGAGTRTITGIKGGKISWKNSKKSGKCTVRSFDSWKAGKNLSVNRSR